MRLFFCPLACVNFDRAKLDTFRITFGSKIEEMIGLKYSNIFG